MALSIVTQVINGGTQYQIIDTSTGITATTKVIQIFASDQVTKIYDSGFIPDSQSNVVVNIGAAWKAVPLSEVIIYVQLSKAEQQKTFTYLLPTTINIQSPA